MQLSLDSENISYSLLRKDISLENSTGAVYETLLTHNLDKYYHPASLLKLFTAVILELELISNSSRDDLMELEKALLASIRDSDNDALAFIMDVLAPQEADYNFLSEAKLLKSCAARKEINNFFQSRGFSSQINIANKCFSFDYYGKEAQIFEKLGANKITAQDLIDLLIMIEASCPLTFSAMQRKLVLESNSEKEIPSSIIDTQDYQIEAFAGKILKEKLGLKEIYSKAGWTSKVRHDAVIFDYALAKGDAPKARYILTVMTEGFSHGPELLQKVVKFLISECFSFK